MSRLRLIAGPNGSGKSSIFQLIKEFKEKQQVIRTGPFINADSTRDSSRTHAKGKRLNPAYPLILKSQFKHIGGRKAKCIRHNRHHQHTLLHAFSFKNALPSG